MIKKLLLSSLLLSTCALWNAQKVLRQDLEKENTEIEAVIRNHQNPKPKVLEVKKELKYLNTSQNKIDHILYDALLANGYTKIIDSENKTSENHYLRSIANAKAQNHQPLMVWTNLNYIWYLYYFRNYNKLLPQLLNTLRVADQIQDKDLLMPLDYYKKMGWIMQTFGHNKKSIEYLEKAQKIANPKSSEYAAIIDAIGLNYLAKEDYKNAEKRFNSVLELSQELKDDNRTARALGNLAVIYQKRGDLNKAEGFLLLDIDYSKKSNDHQNTMYASILLSKIYLEKNKINLAQKHIQEAERIALSKKYFRSSELEILKTRLAISEKNHQNIDELQLRRRISMLEDSLSHSDGTANVRNARWQILENEFSTQIEKKNKEMKNQELIENLLIILVSAVTVSAVFIYLKSQGARQRKKTTPSK